MNGTATTLDVTIAQDSRVGAISPPESKDCCLVQIYPTNIVDGLMRIEKEELSIGRESNNDLCLADGSVSRFHAKLIRSPQGFRVVDLGSTNGTFVNDHQVSNALLQGGEIVRFGSFLFKFLAANAIEAQYYATVYAAMTRDGLTGAFNKNYLLDSLSHEIARHRRCARPLSVLLMDIDHFKKINDTHGHLVGDEVLREFCRRIDHAKREDDLLCRYGGEEFAMILSETELPDAVAIAEGCRNAVSATTHSTSDGELHVTVSIGVAQLPQSRCDIDTLQLLKRADENLYRAKSNGRNQVAADDPV